MDSMLKQPPRKIGNRERTAKMLFTDATTRLGLPANEATLIIKMATGFTDAMASATTEGLIKPRIGFLIADLTDKSFGDLLKDREKLFAGLSGTDEKAEKMRLGLEKQMATYKLTLEEAKIMTSFISAAGVTLAMLSVFGELPREVGKTIMRRFQNNIEAEWGLELTQLNPLVEMETKGNA